MRSNLRRGEDAFRPDKNLNLEEKEKPTSKLSRKIVLRQKCYIPSIKMTFMILNVKC